MKKLIFLFCLLFAFCQSEAQKISALPAASSLTTSETSIVVQSGTTKKATLALWPISTATQTALDLKAPLASPTFTGSTASANLTLTSYLNEAKGADIASATTTDIGAATGNYVNVTGTVTITGLGTVAAGARRIVQFSGALTLTHNGTSLILPGAANITTVAGDVAMFVSLGSGNWKCAYYMPTTTTGTGSRVLAASPTFTGTPTLPTGSIATTQSVGDSSTKIATTAFVENVKAYGQYKTLADYSASHIAGQVAGTYSLNNGNAAIVSGGSSLYTVALVYIATADYPTVNGVAAKLRIRAECIVNDVAPTGNFTFGLYPVTHTGTTGGTAVNIYTLGTVVSGSNGAAFTTPAADAISVATGSDFAVPSDGFYAIGVVTTQTVASSSLVHLHAQLQQRNN